MKKLPIYILLATFFALASCNDLSQDVHSEITDDNFFQNEEQVLSAAGPAYSNLRSYTGVAGIWGVNEFTSDEMVLPTRGRHWYNDGMYQRYQRHEWHAEEGNTNAAWGDIFDGINTCNRLLAQYEQLEEKSEAVEIIMSELRGIRAFWYFTALDMFGNVPLVTEFEDAEAAPSNSSQQEIFNFVEQELLDAIPNLRGQIGADTYGRFHKWAGYATLAKLYMNAEVYTGESHWDEALDALNAIIDSGHYSLESDYFANFAVENQGSNENIFVIPYDNTHAGGFQIHYWTIHFNGNRAINMQSGGWDGYAGSPSFVRSFDDEDTRKDMWLTGVQTTPEGDTLHNNQELPSDSALVYTVDISSLENASENEGARFMKYDYRGSEGDLSNDFAIFRYADILLLKAEALMRLNGETATQEAVDLVNEVRDRADRPDYTTGSLTMEELLAERGREMAGEGWRRHDQIRFGDFTGGSWDWKDPSPDYRKIFPIPEQQLNANPNLNQNPGY